jgi:hypothetical protein
VSVVSIFLVLFLPASQRVRTVVEPAVRVAEREGHYVA